MLTCEICFYTFAYAIDHLGRLCLHVKYVCNPLGAHAIDHPLEGEEFQVGGRRILGGKRRILRGRGKKIFEGGVANLPLVFASG